MMTHSRDMQDIFIYNIFNKKQNGNYVDIGCQYPIIGNNTFLLEKNGWNGISFDIVDYTGQWKERKTPFILTDALKCNFKLLFEKFKIPMIVDYLNLDVEGDGDRFDALVNVFKAEREFKTITIEHDAYRGFEETERVKQRAFLLERNYFLLCSNVMCIHGAFEDWWINPNYFDLIKYKHLICEGKFPKEIIELFVN